MGLTLTKAWSALKSYRRHVRAGDPRFVMPRSATRNARLQTVHNIPLVSDRMRNLRPRGRPIAQNRLPHRDPIDTCSRSSKFNANGFDPCENLQLFS